LAKVTQKKYHHGDLKAALLIAAERLIAVKGTDSLSLRNLASEVGVSHMAPYAHFKNKSDLFKAVATSCYLKLGQKLQEIQDQDNNPHELVLLYGVAYVEFATQNPQLYNLMLSQTHPQKSKSLEEQPLTEIDISLREASKKPFLLLRDGFTIKESDENKLNIHALGAWALVHGVSTLLNSGQIPKGKNFSIKQFLKTATEGIAD